MGMTACTTASVDDARQAAAANAPASADVAPAPLDRAAADLLPAEVKAKGVLTVGTDPTYPPFEFYAPDNKTVIGLDADVAKALGETLGVKVQMVPATFDTILPGLNSHKYDIGLSAFNVTAERKKNADFAEYQLSGSALAVQPGNPKHLSVDPMTLCGTKVGGEKGTTQGIETLPAFSKQCTDAGKPAIDIQLFPTQDEANTALASGRVDSILSGLIGMGYASKLSNGAFQLASDASYNPTPVGMAMARGSALTPAVVAAVKDLMTSDTYRQINAKYGLPQSVAVSPDAVDARSTK
jgi:polar amino acid transport system substrate-binding protein